MPSRPPGRRTRKHSANTAGRSVDKLITQLEMITSTEPSGSGIASIWPRRNTALCAPASRALARARSSISLVMSRPYAVPAGPTRRADSSTSMPPPGAQVQHRLPRMQVRHRDRVTAAEAGPHRAAGQAAGVRVPGRAEAARRERVRFAVGDRLARLRGPGQAAVPGGDRRPDPGHGQLAGGLECHGDPPDGRRQPRAGRPGRSAHHQVRGGGKAVHAVSVDPVQAGRAPLLGEHEPHRGQLPQVLGDGGLPDRHGRRDLLDRQRLAAARQQGHHLDPGAVGQGPEPGRVRLGGLAIQRLRIIHR